MIRTGCKILVFWMQKAGGWIMTDESWLTLFRFPIHLDRPQISVRWKSFPCWILWLRLPLSPMFEMRLFGSFCCQPYSKMSFHGVLLVALEVTFAEKNNVLNTGRFACGSLSSLAWLDGHINSLDEDFMKNNFLESVSATEGPVHQLVGVLKWGIIEVWIKFVI